jgi:hypothetical protein
MNRIWLTVPPLVWISFLSLVRTLASIVERELVFRVKRISLFSPPLSQCLKDLMNYFCSFNDVKSYT